jgi:hypothetical protein
VGRGAIRHEGSRFGGLPDRGGFERNFPPEFKATAFMGVLIELQGQGESNFRPAFDPPKSQCRLDDFTVGTTRVLTVYSPWEKGAHTLHYRFVTDDADSPREVLVIYDGFAGFVFKIGQLFYIAETRGGETSYYAIVVYLD